MYVVFCPQTFINQKRKIMTAILSQLFRTQEGFINDA